MNTYRLESAEGVLIEMPFDRLSVQLQMQGLSVFLKRPNRPTLERKLKKISFIRKNEQAFQELIKQKARGHLSAEGRQIIESARHELGYSPSTINGDIYTSLMALARETFKKNEHANQDT